MRSAAEGRGLYAADQMYSHDRFGLAAAMVMDSLHPVLMEVELLPFSAGSVLLPPCG